MTVISENKYISPNSVEQAVSAAVEHKGSYRYIAGGTDVMVNKFQGNDTADLLIDLTGIQGLKEILKTDTHIIIGALTTLEELQNQQLLATHFPMLPEAAKSVASPTIRKSATLGGNLLCENRCIFYNQSEWWREAAGRCLKCNGDICLASGGNKYCYSKFVSDIAVVLISLNAEIEIINEHETSVIPLETIYSGDGINPVLLPKTSIIKSIYIPLIDGNRSAFKKLRKRETLDFTSLTTSLTIKNSGSVRIVLGGAHAKPVIVDGSVEDDLEVLFSQVVSNTRIIENDTYSRSYRKDMIRVFLKRSFVELNSKSPYSITGSNEPQK